MYCRIVLLVVFVAILSLVGCGKSPSSQSQQGLFLPPADFVADAGKGEGLFNQYCARCHGRGARGTDMEPPLVHRFYKPAHHGDMTFYLAARSGVRHHHWDFGDMPPVQGVSATEVGHIIAYVRRQQRRAGIQ